MIAIVASIRIDGGNCEKLEQLFGAFTDYVQNHEPDTLAYHLAKVPGQDGAYKILEVYRDEAAMKLHASSEAFKALRPELGEMMIEPPAIELLDVVNSFAAR